VLRAAAAGTPIFAVSSQWVRTRSNTPPEHEAMTEDISSPRISRRSLLRGGAAAAVVAAGLPSCSSSAAGRPRRTGSANASVSQNADVSQNVRVSHDHYGVHVEPSVAVSPRDPRQLLAACQVSPTPNPEFIATYLSLDAGASWQSGAVPQLPAGQTTTGDDVTVAFDDHGRGYVCATSHSGGRYGYVWRTDDGGRGFSAPVALEGEYFDHPWIATGTGQTLSERNVYVAWAGGSHGNALSFTRSTDGGQSFEAPRTIMPVDETGMLTVAGELAAGAHGLVCAVAEWYAHQDASGDVHAQVVAVCSADGGKSFATPVPLGTDWPFFYLPGGVKPNSGPTIAAAPGGDALHVAFTSHRPGAIHSDIMVTASHDGGRTWSTAAAATPRDSVTYFQPNLAVDAAGRVAISAFALANGRVDQVLLLSWPRELRFYPPLTVNAAPFDPHTATATGQKHGAWWIGDYQGIAAGAGAFHLVWNDARTGKLELFAATVRPRSSSNA
jgi:hypothetical protein